jgi:hypothetical protein
MKTNKKEKKMKGYKENITDDIMTIILQRVLESISDTSGIDADTLDKAVDDKVINDINDIVTSTIDVVINIQENINQ